MKVSYDKPRKQQLVITYKLTKDAPDEEAFPSESALVVRTGANRAAGVEWPAVVEALISILPDNPQIAADLKAALFGTGRSATAMALAVSKRRIKRPTLKNRLS